MRSQRLSFLQVNRKVRGSLENSERDAGEGDEPGLVFLLLYLAQVDGKQGWGEGSDCSPGGGAAGSASAVTQV